MATSIVIVRTDLTIVGAEETEPEDRRPKKEGAEFFDILKTKPLDLIVLDCREPRGDGCAALKKIRARTSTPILAICEPNDAAQPNYLASGAVECLLSPFDVTTFGKVIRRIAADRSRSDPNKLSRNVIFAFQGIEFEPRHNKFTGNGVSVKLTASETILLTMLATSPGAVRSRAEIVREVYGSHPPANDRAIDVVVARLRQKLAELQGEEARKLIKTEFRRGYALMCDVVSQLETTPETSLDSPTEVGSDAVDAA